MQEDHSRRSNPERSEATRMALLAAARQLFIDKGYAGTGTPEIAAATGLTRGALYHHFDGKAALYRGVVEGEFDAVASEIEAATPHDLTPDAAMLNGTRAYFAAMRAPGRTRLLIIEAPSVLGSAAMDEIDGSRSRASLAYGLSDILPDRSAAEIDVLARLLGAAFDAAALAVSTGAPQALFEAGITTLYQGLMATSRPAGSS